VDLSTAWTGRGIQTAAASRTKSTPTLPTAALSRETRVLGGPPTTPRARRPHCSREVCPITVSLPESQVSRARFWRRLWRQRRCTGQYCWNARRVRLTRPAHMPSRFSLHEW
jgi:hypothetical protein